MPAKTELRRAQALEGHRRDAEFLDEAYSGKAMPPDVAEAFAACVYFIEREMRARELQLRLTELDAAAAWQAAEEAR